MVDIDHKLAAQLEARSRAEMFRRDRQSAPVEEGGFWSSFGGFFGDLGRERGQAGDLVGDFPGGLKNAGLNMLHGLDVLLYDPDHYALQNPEVGPPRPPLGHVLENRYGVKRHQPSSSWGELGAGLGSLAAILAAAPAGAPGMIGAASLMGMGELEQEYRAAGADAPPSAGAYVAGAGAGAVGALPWTAGVKRLIPGVSPAAVAGRVLGRTAGEGVTEPTQDLMRAGIAAADAGLDVPTDPGRSAALGVMVGGPGAVVVEGVDAMRARRGRQAVPVEGLHGERATPDAAAVPPVAEPVAAEPPGAPLTLEQMIARQSGSTPWGPRGEWMGPRGLLPPPDPNAPNWVWGADGPPGPPVGRARRQPPPVPPTPPGPATAPPAGETPPGPVAPPVADGDVPFGGGEAGLSVTELDAQNKRDEQARLNAEREAAAEAQFKESLDADDILRKATLPPVESDAGILQNRIQPTVAIGEKDLKYHFAVVPLDSLRWSGNTEGGNLDFQNRDMQSANTNKRKAAWLANYRPRELLFNSPTANDGAPVIARSGDAFNNGRLDLQQTVWSNEQYLDQQKKYMRMLLDVGFDADVLRGIEKPTLVRVLDEKMSMAQAREYAAASNETFMQAQSGADLANADATRLANDDFANDLAVIKNKQDMAMKYIEKFVSPQQRLALVKDGRVTGEGMRRVEKGMAAFVFTHNGGMEKQVGRALLSDLDSADEDSVSKKMADLAVGLFPLSLDISKGKVKSEFNVVPAVVDVYNDIVRNKKASASAVMDVIGDESGGGQVNMLDASTGTGDLKPLVAEAFFYARKFSREATDALSGGAALKVDVEAGQVGWVPRNRDKIETRARKFGELIRQASNVGGEREAQTGIGEVGEKRPTLKDYLGMLIRAGVGMESSEGAAYRVARHGGAGATPATAAGLEPPADLVGGGETKKLSGLLDWAAGKWGLDEKRTEWLRRAVTGSPHAAEGRAKVKRTDDPVKSLRHAYMGKGFISLGRDWQEKPDAVLEELTHMALDGMGVSDARIHAAFKAAGVNLKALQDEFKSGERDYRAGKPVDEARMDKLYRLETPEEALVGVFVDKGLLDGVVSREQGDLILDGLFGRESVATAAGLEPAAAAQAAAAVAKSAGVKVKPGATAEETVEALVEAEYDAEAIRSGLSDYRGEFIKQWESPADSELESQLFDGGLDSALDYIAKNSKNEHFAGLAKLMGGQFSGVRVFEGALTDKSNKRNKYPAFTRSTYGRYDPRRGKTMKSYTVHFNRANLSEDEILHEAAHAATINKLGALMKNVKHGVDPRVTQLRAMKQSIEREITKQRKKIKTAGYALDSDRYFGSRRFAYGMDDLDEFLTMSLTDPEMQYVLQHMAYDKGGKLRWVGPQVEMAGKTAWDKVVELVRRLLGVGKRYDTVLDRVLRVTQDIVRAEAGHHYKDLAGKQSGKGGDETVSSGMPPSPESVRAGLRARAQGAVAFQGLLDSMYARLGLSNYRDGKSSVSVDAGKGYMRTGTRAVMDKGAAERGLSRGEYRQLEQARGAGSFIWRRHIGVRSRAALGGSEGRFANEFPAWLLGQADAEFEAAFGEWLLASAPERVRKALTESRSAIDEALKAEGGDLAALALRGKTEGVGWHHDELKDGERFWQWRRAAARRRLYGGRMDDWTRTERFFYNNADHTRPFAIAGGGYLNPVHAAWYMLSNAQGAHGAVLARGMPSVVLDGAGNFGGYRAREGAVSWFDVSRPLLQAGGDALVERYVKGKRLERADWIRGENQRRRVANREDEQWNERNPRAEQRPMRELLHGEGSLSAADSAAFELSAAEKKLFAAADKRWDAMWSDVRRHAVDSGLITAEAAAKWAEMPYAPFLRDRGGEGDGRGGGDPLRARTGGEGAMMPGGEAVERAVLAVFSAGTMNLAKWNVAQLKDTPGGGRWVEAATGRMEEAADQTALSDGAVEALEDIGGKSLARVGRGGFPRAGHGQMVVRQGGKDVVYEVKDADLADAMTMVLEGAKRQGLLELSDGARKFLQRSVTWMPKFAFTQHFADLVSAWGRMPTGKFGDLEMKFKWVKPAYVDALRSGGARLDYEYNAGDFGRVMSDDARDRGWLQADGRRRRGRVKPGMSDRRTLAAFMGQQGVGHAYLQGIKNIELFTRLGAYKSAVEQGATPAQAVLASGTATAQYRLRPKREALQGLSFIMPFFSAALASKPGLLDVAQGGGTGAVARRAAFGAAGRAGKWGMRLAMLAGATALVDQLLTAWNESVGVEDDRTPEDFANWHVWYSMPLEADAARAAVEGRGPDVEVVEMGGVTRIAVRIKKGFEVADVGSVATIGVDWAAGKLTGEQAIDRLWAVGKRAAVPVSAGLFQTAWELGANKDRFGAPIVPKSEEGYGPKGQTPSSPAVQWVTEWLPADWDWAGGERIEHVARGVGLAGGHALWVLDNVTQSLQGTFSANKFMRDLFLSGSGKVRRGRALREAWDKTKEGVSNKKELESIIARGRPALAKRMARSVDGYFAVTAGATAELVRLRHRLHDAGREGGGDAVGEQYKIGVEAWKAAHGVVKHKGARRPEVALRKMSEARAAGDSGALIELASEGIMALQLAIKVKERELLDEFIGSPQHERLMNQFREE